MGSAACWSPSCSLLKDPQVQDGVFAFGNVFINPGLDLIRIEGFGLVADQGHDVLDKANEESNSKHDHLTVEGQNTDTCSSTSQLLMRQNLGHFHFSGIRAKKETPSEFRIRYTRYI